MADWKRAHANAAEHALKHPLVQDVMQEFLHNIGRPNGALERYGLTKIASYVAQVARAEALGIDPETLRMDDAEIAAHQRMLIDAAYHMRVAATYLRLAEEARAALLAYLNRAYLRLPPPLEGEPVEMEEATGDDYRRRR